MQPEEPTTPVTPVVAKPDVTEHPISETEAKKYTGTGDFSMPTSPLDQLGTSDTKLVTDTVGSLIETSNPEKLEDKAVPPKPKKKSGTATKMALAAVLVVLMGAGGVVGMNLMNQTTENRSQAYCAPGGCCCSPQDESWCEGEKFTPENDDRNKTCNGTQQCTGVKNCPTNGEEATPTPHPTTNPNLPECSPGSDKCDIGQTSCQENSEGKRTGYNCSCVDLSPGTCRRFDWQCNTPDEGTCPKEANDPNSNLTACSQYPLSSQQACYLRLCEALGGDGSCAICVNNAFKDTSNGVDLSACPELTNSCLAFNAKREGNCYVSVDGKTPITAYLYRCPGEYTTGGCNDNEDPQTGLRICMDSSYCGTQQLDINHQAGCGMGQHFYDACEEDDNTSTTSSYSCTILNKDKATPKIGDTVTFNCSGSATGTTIDHYDFQYQIDGGDFHAMASTDAVASGARATLKIEKKGNYKVQCRACESQDASRCTAWGVAQ